MKFIKKIVPLCFLGMLAFSACKKDKSSLDLNKISGLAIDGGTSDVLNVFQFDHLQLKPKLLTELNTADLVFEWRINLSPGDTASIAIGSAKDLDAEIRVKPNKSGDYYRLFYQATDKRNGLKYINIWKLNVRNSIGQGLVIAETSDGISTDLSHIMSPLVTENYPAESVKHHIYSAVNGKTIPGIVKQLRFNVEALALFGITDNSIFKVNTADYVLGGANDDLFFTHTGPYQPQALGGFNQSDIYIENGKLYGVYFAISKKFAAPLDAPYSVPAQIAINGNYDANASYNFYDEAHGYFVYLQTIQSFGDRVMHPIPSVSGKAFNPGNLPGKVNLASGIGTDMDFLHLLKDKATGKVNLYILSAAGFDSDEFVVLPPQPKAVFDLSAAPGINEATKFVLYDDQKVMYYATSTKIYAVVYGSSVPLIEERYTAPAGETISTFQIYQDADYPFGDMFMSTNNKQLVMSTYNGSEGKVYILPIKNAGIGNIDLPNIKSYGGFGKITAITTQK